MLKDPKIIIFPNAKATVSPMLPKKPSPNQALYKLRDEDGCDGCDARQCGKEIARLKATVSPMLPKKSSLDTLSNQALCKLRDEIAEELKNRAESLQRTIDQLVGPTSAANTVHRSGPRKGQKVAPKYKGPHGEKWSGRGLKPRWLTAAISEGKRLDDFLINPSKKNGVPKKNHVSEARH